MLQPHEFNRYFLQNADRGGRGGFGGFGSMFGGSRGALSSIIPELVYLTNLPDGVPFPQVEDKADSALVVSCIDISELAFSRLLLEPNAKRVKYHVLAMEDVIATTGSLDQIYDTLALMSTFADCKKPILIHCMQGVGRSAMMTALHLAYRYLQNDTTVTTCLNTSTTENPNPKKLDPTSESFISDLYSNATNFILTKRSCCQFYDRGRNNLAIHVLTEIYSKIQQGQPITSQRNDDYRFLAALVQSSEFKKLQYHYYRRSLNYNLLPESINSIFLNQNDWYKNLVEAVNAQPSDTLKKNPLFLFCIDETSVPDDIKFNSERHDLLRDLMNAIDRISTLYPNAPHSLLVTNHNKVNSAESASTPKII